MREAQFTGQPVYEDADVTKAKLTREKGVNVGLYAEYTLGEAQGLAELTAQHKRPPHADLLAAFARLVPHLCFLCRTVRRVTHEGVSFEWRSPYVASLLLADEVPAENFADYLVTGYSYDDKGGVVLVGQQLLDNGKVLNLIAPREELSPEQETGFEYAYVLLLGKHLRECDEEVKLYLAGKHGPMAVQEKLDFGQSAAGSALAGLQDLVDKAEGYTSVTISGGGHSATLTKRGGKDAAAGSD